MVSLLQVSGAAVSSLVLFSLGIYSLIWFCGSEGRIPALVWFTSPELIESRVTHLCLVLPRTNAF